MAGREYYLNAPGEPIEHRFNVFSEAVVRQILEETGIGAPEPTRAEKNKAIIEANTRKGSPWADGLNYSEVKL